VKDHGVEMLRTQAAESTSIFGPYLSLYQIHSATPETGVLENAQVIGELRRLREGGLFLGVTVTGLSQLETLRRAVDLRFDGEHLFSAVQATWNVLERSAEPGLREAHEAGLAVLVKEPLANGRLTPRGDAGKAGPLRAVAERLGSSADAVALAFVAKENWADIVLLGAATEQQVESNRRARDLKLGEEDLRALEELRLPADEYWSQRTRLAWN
jgi:aryl-alcohol dehydrogenase-like predicted oxidoreductase